MQIGYCNLTLHMPKDIINNEGTNEMTINLTMPTDNFDRAAGFAFEYLDYKKQPQRAEGYLFYDEEGDTMYLMKRSVSLQSSYTDAERAQIDRIYRGAEVVRNGDSVTVDGKPYTVKVLGNYSDAGRLIPA